MRRRGPVSTATLFPLRRIVAVLEDERPIIEQQIDEAQLPPFERELRFAAKLGRNWKFDYAWPTSMIAFEQEGATFGRVVKVYSGVEYRNKRPIPIKNQTIRVGGRHSTGVGFDDDCEKYNYAAMLGWMVIRASTRQIRDKEAIVWLQLAFRVRANVRPQLAL